MLRWKSVSCYGVYVRNELCCMCACVLGTEGETERERYPASLFPNPFLYGCMFSYRVEADAHFVPTQDRVSSDVRQYTQPGITLGRRTFDQHIDQAMMLQRRPSCGIIQTSSL